MKKKSFLIAAFFMGSSRILYAFFADNTDCLKISQIYITAHKISNALISSHITIRSLGDPSTVCRWSVFCIFLAIMYTNGNQTNDN